MILETRGRVGNETDALDLTDVVESDDADERLRVLLGALVDLVQDLGRVGAPVHGQLPHCPVPAVVVPRGRAVCTVHKWFLHVRTPEKTEKNIHKYF